MFPQLPFNFLNNIQIKKGISALNLSNIESTTYIGEIKDLYGFTDLEDFTNKTSGGLLKYADSKLNLSDLSIYTKIQEVKQGISQVNISDFTSESILVGDFVPPLWDFSQITTDFWIDVQDTGTVSISSGVINSVADKSGNGRNATQTGGSRPAYQATGYNGFPCAYMADINDFFSLPTIPRNNGQLVFAIVDTTDCPTYTGGFGYLPFMGNFYLGFPGIDLFKPTYINGSYPDYLVAPSTGRRKFGVMLYYSSTVGGIQIDGSTTFSRNISEASGNWNTYLCIDATTFPDYSAAGIKICEVAIVNPSSVSPSNIDKAWGYLMWKWGLQSLLPTGHPYKIQPPRI